MINEKLYKRTCDILFDAYFNDTLEHDNCYACAVGNLIAANCGYTFIHANREIKHKENIYTGLGTLTWNKDNNFDNNIVRIIAHYRRFNGNLKNLYINNACKNQLNATGYSIEELCEIEKAFEDRGAKQRGMFHGLVSVLEVLKKIHKISDDNEQVNRFKNYKKVICG